MPNEDDDMSAIADMSSAHAVEGAMPSFRMHDWSSMRALYCVRGDGQNLPAATISAVPVRGRHLPHVDALRARAAKPANSIAHMSNAFRSASLTARLV